MTTNFAPGAPNWVDLGTTDISAATTFYGALFGWTVQDMGPDSGGYGIIQKDGRPAAGIGPATDPDRGSSWSVYFATENADESTARVEANGGKVVMAPMDVMDQGRMAVFQDPTGAYFSVWQPGQHTGSEVYAQTGGPCWVELTTGDVDAAKAFYAAVLGAEVWDMGSGDMTYSVLKAGGENVAGMMPAMPQTGDVTPHWSVYFAVDDTDAVADEAVRRGGTEQLRQDSPPGRMAVLTDPQGGSFNIIKPDPDWRP